MGNIVQLPRVQVIFEGREMFLRASQRTQQDLESTSKQNSRRGACVRGDGVQQLPDLMFCRHGMSGAGHRMFLFFRWQYCSVWQSIYSGLKQSMMHYLTVHYLTVRSRPKGSRGQTQSSPSGGGCPISFDRLSRMHASRFNRDGALLEEAPPSTFPFHSASLSGVHALHVLAAVDHGASSRFFTASSPTPPPSRVCLVF